MAVAADEMPPVPKAKSPEERQREQDRADKAAMKQGTMEIEFLQGIAGPRRSFSRGDRVVWRADEARRFIDNGYAKPVPKGGVEQAVNAHATASEKR